jgi:hypothetical protein
MARALLIIAAIAIAAAIIWAKGVPYQCMPPDISFAIGRSMKVAGC